MKRKCITVGLLILVMCIQGIVAAAAEEAISVSATRYLFNKEIKTHEMPITNNTGYILPSESTWMPYAEGGEKHVLISASDEWYVESCPDWVKMYILCSDVNPDSGMTEWTLEPMSVGAEENGAVFYPYTASVFLKVDKNDSQDDRRGVVLLKMADGTSGKITVTQAQYVDELKVEIVKPCANALDFITAGYETDIEVKISNARSGRVQILNSRGEVVHTADFKEEKHAFKYIFEPGCYVIRAEATGEEKVDESCAGYVSKEVVITASELEIIEEIGITRQYLEYVKEREGKRNKPYKDIAGYWTIGYGHLIDEKQAKKYASGWSDKTCEEQLMYDLKKHADIMRERLGEELYSQLKPNQVDALVSMEFNGCGRAVGSAYRLGQCLRNLDTVEDWKIINGFVTWHGILDGTVDVLGLYYRRMEEAMMFLYADYTIKFTWPQPWWLNIGSDGKGTSIHDVPSGKSWYTSIMPTLDVSCSLIEASSAGKAEYITIRSSRWWTIEIDESCTWIQASSYRGSSGTIVEINVDANDGEARHGVVSVSCGATVRTIHVHQNGAGENENSIFGQIGATSGNIVP